LPAPKSPFKKNQSPFLEIPAIFFEKINKSSKYYKIPYKDKNAKNGEWVKAPGEKLFQDLISNINMRYYFLRFSFISFSK